MNIDKSHILFRRATLQDIDDLVKLRIQFLSSIYELPSPKELNKIRIQIKSFFEKSIPTDRFISWVAEQDGKIIATSALTIWESMASFSIKTGLRGRILNMYTILEARNMGIGSKLLDKLIEDGKRLGVSAFSLDTTKDGINIYKKKGFIEPKEPELVYYP